MRKQKTMELNMNIDNMNTLIARMKELKHVPLPRDFNYDDHFPTGGFNMTFYANNCGTPMCIAGHVSYLANADRQGPNIAADWLGLDRVWAVDYLFSPSDLGIPYNDITLEQAITALERIRAIGDGYINLDTFGVWGFDLGRPA